MIQIKVKKLHKDAVLPKFGSDGAAAADLVAVDFVMSSHDACATFRTGIALEIPKGYVGKIYMRSSVHKHNTRQTNAVGIIDSDYRGEILVKHDPALLAVYDEQGTSFLKPYRNGDRVAQIIIEKIPDVEYVEVEELSETERGTGGFGSTGE